MDFWQDIPRSCSWPTLNSPPYFCLRKKFWNNYYCGFEASPLDMTQCVNMSTKIIQRAKSNTNEICHNDMALHIDTMDTAERKITGYDQVGLNNKNASRNSAGSVTKHAAKEICRNKFGLKNYCEIHNVINTRDFPMHTLSLCGLKHNISSCDAVNNLTLCDVVNVNPVTLKNSVSHSFTTIYGLLQIVI